MAKIQYFCPIQSYCYETLVNELCKKNLGMSKKIWDKSAEKAHVDPKKMREIYLLPME